ncbi:MAG: sulfite reductase subunit alpha [Alphaproteobacteria bacterium]|nr:sulfite reductase subunit alpha [Alphaproteobacteria bacterium]
MSHIAPLVPDNAPFSSAERAFINGWLAAYYAPGATAESPAAAAAPPAEEFPWHDPSLPMDQRMELAAGLSMPQRLMAAMAQQDCGQCGYVCHSYAAAIAAGSEKALTRCVPGGKETARKLKELLETGGAPVPATIPAAPAAATVPAPSSGAATVAAQFRIARLLNRAGSAKDTRQVVLSLYGSGLCYQSGDSVGIVPTNCPATVAAIIEALGADPNTDVDCPDGTRRALLEALSRACDIGRPSDEAVEVLASRALDPDQSQKLQALAEGYPGAEPEGADLLDLLVAFPSARPPLQELVSALAPLQPRLYSIACSPLVHGGEVHLTVAAVHWERRGRARKGVASCFLAERATPALEMPVFVQPPVHPFRPPKSDDAPMIMIGPGTGIAPFRAFLQERRENGAKGRNWLFFGDQHRATDFLYEEELTAWHKDGLLTQLDLAFSRDQPERIYVQQRMREQSVRLWSWINDGAHVYVCGAMAMGRDVETALAAIVARQGRMGVGAAKAYLAQLGREGRFVKDIY